MKIGEVSRLLGVPVSTIRYYVKERLLVPDCEKPQYEFNEEDCMTLEWIIKLRNWGFKLTDIHRIVALNIFSGGVKAGEYEDCMASLEQQKKALLQQSSKCIQYISEIEAFQKELEEKYVAFSKEDNKSTKTGVPLKALSILACAHCHKPMRVRNAHMDIKYIYDGIFECDCGYSIEVKNGILYAAHETSYSNDKPDVNRLVYRSASNDVMAMIQMSYNWVSNQIKALDMKRDKVIMETHMNSFFYLYNHWNTMCPDNIYIIQDKFPSIVEMYKTHIERMGIQYNIIYLVAADQESIPICPSSVDLLIDYNSTNESGIYSNHFYLDRMHGYLKGDGRVISIYNYFKPGSMSLKELARLYPDNHQENYTLEYYISHVKTNYRILKQKKIGVVTDSGGGITFVFHCNGEELAFEGFLLGVQNCLDL